MIMCARARVWLFVCVVYVFVFVSVFMSRKNIYKMQAQKMYAMTRSGIHRSCVERLKK